MTPAVTLLLSEPPITLGTAAGSRRKARAPFTFNSSALEPTLASMLLIKFNGTPATPLHFTLAVGELVSGPLTPLLPAKAL